MLSHAHRPPLPAKVIADRQIDYPPALMADIFDLIDGLDRHVHGRAQAMLDQHPDDAGLKEWVREMMALTHRLNVASLPARCNTIRLSAA